MIKVKNNKEKGVDKIDCSFPEILCVNLEKSQANLMTFALETQDEKAKRMYTANARKLQQLTDKLQPYLLR